MAVKCTFSRIIFSTFLFETLFIVPLFEISFASISIEQGTRSRLHTGCGQKRMSVVI
jgi:hypothetical protein